MECLKGLSNDIIETIIIGVQERRPLWDKGMKDYIGMRRRKKHTGEE